MRHWILLLTTLTCCLSASFSNAVDLTAWDEIGDYGWGTICRDYSACTKKVDKFEFVAEDGDICINYNSDNKAFLTIRYKDGETRKVLAPDIYNIDMSGEPDKERVEIMMHFKVDNICAQAVSAVWSLTQYSSDGSVTPKIIETDIGSIPPAAQCHVTVPDQIDFGSLPRGETKQITVPLKFWGGAGSLLSIKSNDIFSDSEHVNALHLGSSEDVIVYLLNEPQEWLYIPSGPNNEKSGIELEATVGMEAETGPLTSNLTVILECM
ncbi:hypothetical protein [Aeromonas bivalvium]|uniref:hypothetical protein n=1 Tax=Aeromonas bivalvium TaxID=440079 RepID=UPI0038D0503E